MLKLLFSFVFSIFVNCCCVLSPLLGVFERARVYVVIERDRCSKFDTLLYEDMIHELFYRHMALHA